MIMTKIVRIMMMKGRGDFNPTIRGICNESQCEGAILAPPSKFSQFSIFQLKKQNFWYDFFLIFQKFIMN